MHEMQQEQTSFFFLKQYKLYFNFIYNTIIVQILKQKNRKLLINKCLRFYSVENTALHSMLFNVIQCNE